MRLHRIVLRARKGEGVLEKKIRVAKPFIDVSPAVAEMKADIASLVGDVTPAAPIARHLRAIESLVHQRRPLLQRLLHRKDGGQLLILDLDRLERILRDLLFPRRY